jgi:hypothetical protein
MLLDEFGTMGAIPNAPKWFNICRQPRISRVISFQSFSQLVDDYGELGAKAIIDSCNVLAWLGGTRGDDAKWASDALGNRTVLAHGEGESRTAGLFGRSPDRGSQSVSEAGVPLLSVSEAGVPLLFPDDLAASSRRRVVAIAREARPMDLRTRPVWSVRAMRRLMTRPAPPACLEAPLPSHPAPVATAAARTPVREEARVVPVAPPAPARLPAPAATPHAPVRVLAKPAPTTPPPAATAAATDPATATDPTTARPARLPTAPVKHGTAYDWTGLP